MPLLNTTPIPKTLQCCIKQIKTEHNHLISLQTNWQWFYLVFSSPCNNILLYNHVFHKVVNLASPLLVNACVDHIRTFMQSGCHSCCIWMTLFQTFRKVWLMLLLRWQRIYIPHQLSACTMCMRRLSPSSSALTTHGPVTHNNLSEPMPHPNSNTMVSLRDLSYLQHREKYTWGTIWWPQFRQYLQQSLQTDDEGIHEDCSELKGKEINE